MKLSGVSIFENTQKTSNLVLVVILVESSNVKVSFRYFVGGPLVEQQRSLKNA